MDKRFVVTLVAIVAVLGGIFWFTQAKDNKKSGTNNTSKTAATVSNHTFGKGSKGVTLIEYGDFQCPACGQYYPIVKEVKTKYENDITFQFRHFPLVQIHKNAMIAARAAEAAGKQNKFWEMHNMLYEQQSVWENDPAANTAFVSYAQQLGLNVDQFKSDMTSQAVLDTINADIEAAQKIGATGTPTFVLDGKKLEELPRSADAFNKLIEDTIAAKTKQ
jgi:protein-disulfide isomerase